MGPSGFMLFSIYNNFEKGRGGGSKKEKEIQKKTMTSASSFIHHHWKKGTCPDQSSKEEVAVPAGDNRFQ